MWGWEGFSTTTSWNLVLEMPIGVTALVVSLGVDTGSTNTWCWLGINGCPVAKDGLELETRRTDVPWEQMSSLGQV